MLNNHRISFPLTIAKMNVTLQRNTQKEEEKGFYRLYEILDIENKKRILGEAWLVNEKDPYWHINKPNKVTLPDITSCIAELKIQSIVNE